MTRKALKHSLVGWIPEVGGIKELGLSTKPVDGGRQHDVEKQVIASVRVIVTSKLHACRCQPSPKLNLRQHTMGVMKKAALLYYTRLLR